MKIIALKGEKNSGKSHTINIVYQFLLREGYTQVPGHFRVLGNPVMKDFTDVLIKKKTLVGIVGMGDYERGTGSLKKLLDELKDQGCDIAICACQSRPNIIKAVSDFPDHIFVDKAPASSAESEHRIINFRDAQRIIETLKL